MRVSLLLFFTLGIACDDTQRDRELSELGGEAATVAPGELHRPGQPCGVCHGGAGPAHGRFSLSGTVFWTADSQAPVAHTVVRIIDSLGAQYAVRSNCAGNFFVRDSEFEPHWPAWVKLEFANKTLEMRSPISRERSCAGCHADPASASSVGHVYMSADATPLLEAECN